MTLVGVIASYPYHFGVHSCAPPLVAVVQRNPQDSPTPSPQRKTGDRHTPKRSAQRPEILFRQLELDRHAHHRIRTRWAPHHVAVHLLEELSHAFTSEVARTQKSGRL